MTAYIISDVFIGDRPLASGDSLTITRNGTLAGAVSGNGAAKIVIDGAITTANLAISQNGGTTNYNSLNIVTGASSSINAYQVSDIYGRCVVYWANAGSITANVPMNISFSQLSFTNSGSITVTSTAMSLGVYGAATIANSGTMTGTLDGISSSSGNSSSSGYSAPSLYLNNTGVITGGRYGLRLGSEPDTVLNAGLISGGVVLGPGDDSLDTSVGHIAGAIWAGTGADRVIGSADGDLIYGEDPSNLSTDAGNDYLWGGFGDDVINGGYGADQLYGCQGDDILYGNQDNDWMHGGQGDDVIYGGQGDDVINGGKGNDGLFGNLGVDYFVFNTEFGHDVIYDFGNGADVIVFSTDVFSDFATIQSHMTAVLNGTLITDNAGDTLLIIGITPANLTSAMFGFG